MPKITESATTDTWHFHLIFYLVFIIVLLMFAEGFLSTVKIFMTVTVKMTISLSYLMQTMLNDFCIKGLKGGK